jgi:2-methylisocitrate lyase-like PEP mutase family enzyme
MFARRIGGMSEHNTAAALRALHVPGDPLMLPNAWDAASARAIEAAGFPVVATSSFAISEVLGYADGEDTPVTEMLAAVTRITRVVSIPVTVDIERGYGLAPAELVERIAAAGAVGVNLEDSDPKTKKLLDPGEQEDFLAAVRAAAGSGGIDLVINARTDSYVRRIGTAAEQLANSIKRGGTYLAAGADCVYPIGAADPDAVRALTAGIPGPVNVGFPGGTRDELAALGVARVSFGAGLHRGTKGQLGSMLEAIKAGRSPYPK